MKVIPIKARAGFTGFESPAAEYKVDGLSLELLLICHPNATFIGLATGHSMREVGIFNGDILIVDRSVKPKHYDVIIANYNSELLCKIIDMHRQQLFVPSNKINPITIGESDSFIVEGVVTSSIRMLKKSETSNKCQL